MSLILAKVPFIMSLLAVIWVIVMVLLSLIILIQKGKGGGLGAAFGGAGAGSLLGTKTGDFLTWVTIGFTIVFLVLAVILGKYYKPESIITPTKEQAVKQPLEQAPADAAQEPKDAPVETPVTDKK